MSNDSELLREIRDLLQVIAEPALAERDKRRRASLLEIVGNSKTRAEAVGLMDGTRVQSVIQKATKIDVGGLSRLVKAMRNAGLLESDDKHPKLNFHVPHNFFEFPEKEKR